MRREKPISLEVPGTGGVTGAAVSLAGMLGCWAYVAGITSGVSLRLKGNAEAGDALVPLVADITSNGWTELPQDIAELAVERVTVGVGTVVVKVTRRNPRSE